ncbi:MAG: hypothetical protein M1833_005968 [Piccolia ochrophora]|nr:MAG: hypothetical protein M1833_005968 [Piccolia ochrophora]
MLIAGSVGRKLWGPNGSSEGPGDSTSQSQKQRQRERQRSEAVKSSAGIKPGAEAPSCGRKSKGSTTNDAQAVSSNNNDGIGSGRGDGHGHLRDRAHAHSHTHAHAQGGAYARLAARRASSGHADDKVAATHSGQSISSPSPLSPPQVQAAQDSPPGSDHGYHVPHLISKIKAKSSASKGRHPFVDRPSPLQLNQVFNHCAAMAQHLPQARTTVTLPEYMTPLPDSLDSDDVEFLSRKGALTIPTTELRNELLRCYVLFVHSYMPILDLHGFLDIIDRGNGDTGRVSLLLFQAVMFVSTAFVDIQYLQDAGFTSRREARKVFFHRTRLLYDFEYEADRIPLIQALLLMSCWYETPDDQRDMWHWLGIAISSSHTIGLHRNTAGSSIDSDRQKLWKRIWWTCYMRDRLVALGLRRSMRVQDSDFDVPMLTMEDFDLTEKPSEFGCVGLSLNEADYITTQRRLAEMCIQKAKLCVCIGHVLSAQYSVSHNNQGTVTTAGVTRTSMSLSPKKGFWNIEEVKKCDVELDAWFSELPVHVADHRQEVRESGMHQKPSVVHLSLLHMIYNSAVSALHRPQALPSGSATWDSSNDSRPMHESSKMKVQSAATEITQIIGGLNHLDLVRFLPITGVTVLLPAIIVHLLNIKSLGSEERGRSLYGFGQCMQAMYQLRDSYAAADYALACLDAAIRKAEVPIPLESRFDGGERTLNSTSTSAANNRRVKAGLCLTPPPERSFSSNPDNGSFASFDPALTSLQPTLNAYTPPLSAASESLPGESHSTPASTSGSQDFVFDGNAMALDDDFDRDFNALVNLDEAAEPSFAALETDAGSMSGLLEGTEGASFGAEVDWLDGDGQGFHHPEVGRMDMVYS